MTTDGMTAGDWISAGLNVLQAAVIVFAVVWAYYKFVRGRTFHRRAELKVEASLLKGAAAIVRAEASMTNTGGAVIPLRVKALIVSTFTLGDVDAKGWPIWRELKYAPTLADHEWIESQETVNDDVLIPLPQIHDDVIALRVTCVVYEKRRWYKRWRRGGTVTWTAKSVIPLAAEVPST